MKKMRIMTVMAVIALAIPFATSAQTAKPATTTKTPAAKSQAATPEKQKTTVSTGTGTSTSTTSTSTSTASKPKSTVHKMPRTKVNATAKPAPVQSKSVESTSHFARAYHPSMISELKKKHKKGAHHTTHHAASKKAPSGNGN